MRRYYFFRHMIRKILIISIIICSCNSHAEDVLSFQEVQPPLYGRAPSNLSFYSDLSGKLGLAYKYTDSKTPGGIFYTHLQDDVWIEPQAINFLNANNSWFGNTTALTNSTTMMLLRGDDTSYGALFGLSEAPASPQNDTDPILQGISNEDLIRLLNDNQRLFFSINGGAGWSGPQAIPGTNKAQNAVLLSGGNDTAIAVFSIDEDGDTTTLSDMNLYYAAYENGLWKQPAQLTNNSLLNYNVKIVYVNNEYVVAWVVDEDADAGTITDSRLYYSVVTSTGILKTPASAVFSQVNSNAAYVLGSNSTDALLVWSEKQVDGTYLLQESHYRGSAWSTAQSSPISAPNFKNGKMFDVGGNLLLAYQQDNSINLARHTGSQWLLIESINDLNDDYTSISEVEYAIVNDVFWVAYAGHVPVINEGQDPDIGDGLYVSKYALTYDLSVSLVGINPRALNIAREVELNFDVENKGVADSVAYNFQIWESGTMLTSMRGASLVSGGKQNFKYRLTPQKIEIPIKVTVVADALDGDNTNNTKNYPLAVKPDFYIKNIDLFDDVTVKVEVRERKGIPASSPTVDAYLIQGTSQTLIASSRYNPESMEPLMLPVSGLSGINGSYKILVKVNSKREIIEDSYVNNNGVYEFKPAIRPDFTVSGLQVTSTDVTLNIENIGVANSSAIDLLITDDPEQAIQNTSLANPWHLRQVTLDATNKSIITIQRSALPAITGLYLYAVINPYNIIMESERNNNRIQKLVATNVSPNGTVGLVYQNDRYICNNLVFDVVNSGTISAKQVSILLTSSTGVVVASTQIPLLNTATPENVIFHNVDSGSYELTIVHVKDGIAQTQVSQLVTLTNDGCDSATNDISLAALNYVGVNPDTGLSDFDADIRITGYGVDYRKPLIRLPLTIEIKQGTSLVTSLSKLIYVSPTINQNLVRIEVTPSDLPLSGGYTFILKLKNRGDETQTTNNILSTGVN